MRRHLARPVLMTRPQKKAFRVPNKYGPQPIVYPRRNGGYRRNNRRGGRGRGGRGGLRAPPRPPMGMQPIPMRPMLGLHPGNIPMQPPMMPPPMMPPANMPLMQAPGNLPPQMIPPSNIPMMPPSNLPPNSNNSNDPPVPPSLWIPPLNSGNSNIPRQPVVPPGFALGNLVGPKVVNVSQEPKGEVKHPDVIQK